MYLTGGDFEELPRMFLILLSLYLIYAPAWHHALVRNIHCDH